MTGPDLREIDGASWAMLPPGGTSRRICDDGIHRWFKYDDEHRAIVRGEATWGGLSGEREYPPVEGELLVLYEDYIESSVWKRTRELVIAEYGGSYCALKECGSSYRVQVHHRTYERLGWEHREDLIPLCKSCHERFHVAAREIRERRRRPPV